MALARACQGALALALVLLYLGFVALPWILLLSVPARFMSTRRRLPWVSRWARLQARIILGGLGLGGARYEREGHVPTDAPGLILMNHQSVLDIPTAMLMCLPLVPAFVARARYAKVPMIRTGLWLAHCPIIRPGLDRDGALETLSRAMSEDRAFLLYPEGHRTKDGSLQPFRTAGLMAMLGARRVPVWLVATDGFWSGRRLVDLVRLDRIRGRTTVVGRFDPPEGDAELPAFLAMLEKQLARAVGELRERRPGGGTS